MIENPRLVVSVNVKPAYFGGPAVCMNMFLPGEIPRELCRWLKFWDCCFRDLDEHLFLLFSLYTLSLKKQNKTKKTFSPVESIYLKKN